MDPATILEQHGLPTTGLQAVPDSTTSDSWGTDMKDMVQWQDSWESRVHSLTQELLSMMAMVVEDYEEEEDDNDFRPFATKSE